jgi:hypothetical protein
MSNIETQADVDRRHALAEAIAKDAGWESLEHARSEGA